MKLTLCGNSERGANCLESILREGKDEVVNVVTHHGNPETAQEMLHLAKENNLPVFSPAKINREESIKELKSYEPDVMVLAGYNQILKSGVIDIAPLGCINLHGGKLPDYRGASVLNWAIINGESEIGLSIIYVDRGIDTGDIITETSFPLNYEDTIKEVQETVQELFPPLLLKTLDKIRNNTVNRKPQNIQEGKYWRKRRPEDGEINWKESADNLYNFVRALTKPYPGAFTHHKGNRLSVWDSTPLSFKHEYNPGTIVNLNPLEVAAGKGMLILEDVDYNFKNFKIGDILY